MFSKSATESLPPPGPKLESILMLIPAKSEESVVLKRTPAGSLMEWRPPDGRPLRFQLDPMGTDVYEAIDGSRSLGEAVEAFAAEHRLTFFESCALWVAYCRTLRQRNLIHLNAPDDT